MATRDANHQQLIKQAGEINKPSAPPMPKLGQLMKGFCNPQQQNAFDRYDQMMEEWQRGRQVSGT